MKEIQLLRSTPVAMTVTAAGLLGLLLTGSAIASSPAYMKADCLGESEDLLPLQTMHHEVERPEDGGAEFEGMRVVRKVDQWSPEIIQHLTASEHCPELLIKVYSDEDETQLEWQVELENSFVRHRKEWKADGKPMEALRIKSNDEVTWKHFDDDGLVRRHCWDFRRQHQC
ncbi:type VI secretion system tube protein Hcp [Wenzhouxiangella sp. AB-CW3]|uniref:type VI secretion system tube protein Hcp n=1 Tax=Wenzhouxiangella sp. AB-CW3 TaxID=2771012 RepID=UPI00168A4822|nr:type VI secretion system tube protein Hcp [Wenzhouxiangella sp. AB-CW3]QOC21541.1 type VI secretion system tube protein Hcp [Wenzhouxiangella sp. AB-CW3]